MDLFEFWKIVQIYCSLKRFPARALIMHMFFNIIAIPVSNILYVFLIHLYTICMHDDCLGLVHGWLISDFYVPYCPLRTYQLTSLM